MKSIIKVKFLRENAQLPSRYSSDSAGFDLYAIEETVIPASVIDNERRLNVGAAIIPTGLAIQLPHGTVGKLASRSGFSMNFNIENQVIV
jgi:dUTP pyrophosphatase